MAGTPDRVFSFEFFPPATPEGVAKLRATRERLARLADDLAGAHEVEQLGRHRHEIAAPRGVRDERRPRRVERALLREDPHVEGRHGA